MTFSIQYIVILFEDRHLTIQGWGREQTVSGLRFFFVCFSFLHYIVFYLFRILFHLSVVALQFCVSFTTIQQNRPDTYVHPLSLISFPSSHQRGSRRSSVCYTECSLVIYLVHSVHSVYVSGSVSRPVLP